MKRSAPDQPPTIVNTTSANPDARITLPAPFAGYPLPTVISQSTPPRGTVLLAFLEPQPIKVQPPEMNPNAYWREESWLESSTSGRKPKNGSFVRFMDGQMVSDRRLTEIRKLARDTWSFLADQVEWRAHNNKNTRDFQNHYRAVIETAYPELTLCESHWKADKITTETYPNWVKAQFQENHTENLHPRDLGGKKMERILGPQDAEASSLLSVSVLEA